MTASFASRFPPVDTFIVTTFARQRSRRRTSGYGILSQGGSSGKLSVDLLIQSSRDLPYGSLATELAFASVAQGIAKADIIQLLWRFR